jgi:hypothetical protein
MSRLRNIIYNCREATYLIEKKLVGKITLREKAQLHIHFYGCSVCKLFNKQSHLLNTMMKQLVINNELRDLKLDEEFKNKMQHRIEAELNKK